MSLPAAYVGVIILWSTTPLAIQWSGDGTGFLFGVASRMTIGAAVALLLVRLLRVVMPWHGKARETYVASGLGIYAAMLCVYWAAQYIPSGWISVLFGLSPIITGVMATLWLDERAFTPAKLGGMLLGLVGLVVIFGTGLDQGAEVIYGILAMLLSVTFHSLSSVWVKRIDAGLNGLTVSAGGLMVCVPLFLLTWVAAGTEWPQQVPLRAGLSIVYLAIFGSVLGFALYYYVLRQVEASRVALIALVTPVTALLLGNVLNGEPVSVPVYLGAVLILFGLGIYEWGGRRMANAVVEE